MECNIFLVIFSLLIVENLENVNIVLAFRNVETPVGILAHCSKTDTFPEVFSDFFFQ